MGLVAELKRRNVFRVGIAYMVLGWVVIQVTDTVAPALGLPDWTLALVTWIGIIGFPFALLLAWAFELTPEGIKRDQEVDRSESIRHVTGRKLDFAIIGLLVVALGFVVWDAYLSEPPEVVAITEAVTKEATAEADQESADKSIAVLPFVNMSEDASNEYFSDGISEELLNLLTRIPELRVIARTSSFSYKGKDTPIADIAAELNVDHVLEGSVRKAGDQVRITVQLIRANDSSHLWSESYDRTLNDIFAIQDEIAAMVVTQLKVTLLGETPQVEQVDPEAYELFLQARHLYRQGTAENLRQSEFLLKQALDIESEYAAAWVWLAMTYEEQMYDGLLPYDEAAGLAREAISKAIASDPDNPRALSVLGSQAMQFDHDAVAAARHLGRALDLAPDDPSVIVDAAFMMATIGRFGKAITLQEYVVSQDPVVAVQHAYLGEFYLLSERWDEAIESYSTALRLGPEARIGAHYDLGIALLFKGDTEAALGLFEQEADKGYRVTGMALAYHDLGQIERHEALMKELEELMGDLWPSGVARVYAYIEHADQAFSWLHRAISARHYGLSFHIRQPLFNSIKDDPRWAEVLERLGLSPEQLEGVELDVPTWK